MSRKSRTFTTVPIRTHCESCEEWLTIILRQGDTVTQPEMDDFHAAGHSE